MRWSPGEVTIASLTDAVQDFVMSEGLDDVDIVGSSMGARMVMELARRGHGGTTVALDPGGFWNGRQAAVFGATIKASIALLAQFSAHPWKFPQDLVLTELRGFKTSPSSYEALDSLVHAPRQEGAPAGGLNGKLVIGWGRQDKVTVPNEARRATELFPTASLHWFASCGHLPHWPLSALGPARTQTAELILSATA